MRGHTIASGAHWARTYALQPDCNIVHMVHAHQIDHFPEMLLINTKQFPYAISHRCDIHDVLSEDLAVGCGVLWTY